jgi:hypothetical protein
MKKVFILAGWLSLIVIPLQLNTYLKKDEFNTRWGAFSGTSARDALLGYVLIELIWGSYALWEAYKYFRVKYASKKNY